MTMTEDAVRSLCSWVTRHGEPMWGPSAQAYLHDCLPQHPAAREVLYRAVLCNAPAELRAASAGELESVARRLCWLLETERVTPHEQACWAIEAWAQALGRPVSLANQPQKDREEFDRSSPPSWPSYLRFPPVADAGLQFRVSPTDGMPQVMIPAGVFLMGASRPNLQAAVQHLRMKPEELRDEQPARNVMLSAYWIDLHPVTVSQYRRFCHATDHRLPEQLGPDLHPVTRVDWHGATAYAAWVQRALPTEAQWEKAARGGSTSLFPWGDDWRNEHAARGVQPGQTTTVCSYAPNAYGLYDAIGNVWEWCRDRFAEDWYREMPRTDPVNLNGPDGMRVCRGGSWEIDAKLLRVAYRARALTGLRDRVLGFRCVTPAPA